MGELPDLWACYSSPLSPFSLSGLHCLLHMLPLKAELCFYKPVLIVVCINQFVLKSSFLYYGESQPTIERQY